MATGDSTTTTSAAVNHQQNPGSEQQKIIIQNKSGEKLVGILHETGSKEIVILCHGFQSTKEYSMMVELAVALEKQGISAFRFDFSGNGESEGTFEFGNYRKEVNDLHAVVQHFTATNHIISAILGHSKGEVSFRVTEESLLERLNTNMHEAGLSIDQDCKVLTIHGSEDEIIPVEDGLEFAKIIPNHKLQIVEGADHCYNKHREELVSTVLAFIKENLHRGDTKSRQTLLLSLLWILGLSA
ncbi:alpha/beta hydrolase fold protein [Tanacetum coccineum]